MKKSFSTKMLALIMAVLMLATSIPFSASAASTLPVSKSGAYLFAYFKDDGDQQKLFLALSKDGYRFEELNAGKEIPLDYSQTDSGHIRDPFIFNANENDPSNYGYYIIATDMDAKGWGAGQERQHSANIWAEESYSTGFVHLNNIDMDDRTEGSLGKLMADKFGDKECNRFWAPEVIWDPTYITDATPNGAYMMSFGFCFSDWSRGTRLYYAHTLDFKTFFDCGVLLELKDSTKDATRIIDSIDSDIIEYNGDYYMFFKNEADTGDLTSYGKRVFVTKSKTGKPYGPYYDTITDNTTEYPFQISKNDTAFEGPAAYRIDGTDTVMIALDDFTTAQGAYRLVMTSDFKNFTQVGDNDFQLTTNNQARHASVVHISDEEYDALVAKYGKWTDTQTSDAGCENINEHLVARYFVNSNPGEDVSGNGNDIGSALVPGVVNNCKTVVKDGRLAVDFTNNATVLEGNNPATSNDVPQNLWVDNTAPWANRADGNRRLISRNFGTYASIETAGLLADADVKNGVTIAFDAMTQANGDLHVIDISNAKDYGYINSGGIKVLDQGKWVTDAGNPAFEYNENKAAFQNSREVFIQMDESNRSTVRESNLGSEYETWFDSTSSEWHTYSLTFTKGMITIYVDGVKVNQVKNDRYDEAWFNELFKSNTVDNTKLTGKSKIGIGVSHWIADYLFTGYISNLCIYDRALSQGDIAQSNKLFTEAAQVPVNEGQVIYEDLLVKKDSDGNVTENKFDNYQASDLLTNEQTKGYGQMLNINNKTIDSVESVKDTEGISPSGYTYNIWVNPNDTIDEGILMRQGSDQYHLDIKENGVVEFKYSTDVAFATPSLFTLTPNKVQNVTIQVSPYGDYDRITAYVDGVHTGTYDVYRILENSTITAYPSQITVLKFINYSGSYTNTSNLVRYGDSSTSASITGVTIHRGAVDASDLYLEKFSSLAEGLYNNVRETYIAKMNQFDIGEHFWKNMTPAYEAYNNLNRYLDAITYGDAVPNTDYLVDLVSKLDTATKNMTAYTASSSLETLANYNVTFNGVASEGASTGVLRATDITENSGTTNDIKIMTGGGEADSLLCNVCYGPTLFLYTGQPILTMPIALKTQVQSGRSSSKNRRLLSAYPCTWEMGPLITGDRVKTNAAYNTVDGMVPSNHDAFFVGENKQKSQWYGWNNAIAYNTSGNRELGYDKENTSQNYSGNITSTGFFYNILNIDTAKLRTLPDINGGTDSVQGEYQISWNVYGTSDESHFKDFDDSYQSGVFTKYNNHYNQVNDSVVIEAKNSSIYVLDATLLDINNDNCPIKQDDPTAYVKHTVPNPDNSTQNVLSYRVSSRLLKAIDMYTSFDAFLKDELDKYNDVSAIYNNVAPQITNNAENYTEAMSVAKDFIQNNNLTSTIDYGYTELKAQLKDETYLDNVASIETEHKLTTGVTIGDTTYPAGEVFTTDSAEAFKATYDKAVAHFTSLDPRNGNVQYADREASSNTATKLNAELDAAYSKLMPVADYQPVKTELENSYSCELGLPVDGKADVQQNYSLKSWLGLVEKQEAAASYANDAPAENALYTSAQKANQAKYVADANGVVDRTQTSDIQNNIQNAADALRTYINPEPDTVEHLEAPATAEHLQNYNTAQSLASRVDLEAYDEAARTTIDNNLNMGYVSADKVVRAGAYTDGGVYVTYGDGVYVYTNDADTDAATKKVVEGINAATTVNPDGTAHLGGYEVNFRVYVDGVEQTDAAHQLEVYNFGNNVSFDASSYDNGSYDVINWQVTGNKPDSGTASDNISNYNSRTILKDTGFTAQRPIQQDTFVQLYLRTKVADKTKITVVDDFGVQLEVAYINGSSADFEVVTDEATNALKFTDVNGTEFAVNPVTSANFTFSNWRMYRKSDNELFVAQVSTMKELKDYARYTAIGGTVNAGANFTAEFNTYVDFVASIDNFFAWIKSVDGGNTWYVASYDANFRTTSVPTDADGIIYRAVTEAELTNKIDGTEKYYIADSEIRKEAVQDKIPFAFGTAVNTVTVNGAEKFRLYCDYTVNSNMSANVRVVQAGVLYATGDVAPVNFVKGADGVRTVAANAVSDTNSYTATTSVKAQTGYMRAYVSYMYKTTDPSDPTKTVEVPMVAYGPVVSCSSGAVISK